MRREARCNMDDPLIMAIDVARGGDDAFVFCFRRGLDARTIPWVKIPGSEARDSMKMVSKAVELIKGHNPDAVFIDSTGIGGPIGDRLRQLGYNCIDVGFGSSSPTQHYANMRSYIWGEMKDWLKLGAIPDEPGLEMELSSPEYHHNKRDQLVLQSKEMMKKDGKISPDQGDALAISFAYSVAPVNFAEKTAYGSHGGLKSEYNPFSDENLEKVFGE